MSVLTEETRNENQEEISAKIDFKMVTFSLVGKEYGIDIMRVDGIAKAGNFTYVPNTPSYVLGVYNLRGNIISVIDLRKMLNLEVGRVPDDGLENVLILGIEDHLIGVVVDSIDKVVAIASDKIQPPHPFFQDINIKYLSGVVENEQSLYLILDVDKIFGKEENFGAEPEIPAYQPEAPVETGVPAQDGADVELEFISETLATFKNFHTSNLNDRWVRKRLEDWKKLRSEQKMDFQLANAQDADSFLLPFYTPYTGALWGDDYRNNLARLLPQSVRGPINVWNPGAASGHESYSIAALLKRKYSGSIIKIWAHDNDLLGISNGPNLAFPRAGIPKWYLDEGLISEGANGYQFAKEIKDMVLFEYHDILHGNRCPEVDLIVARDLLSFLQPEDQAKILVEFAGKLKSGGLLVLGQNEKLQDEAWYAVTEGNVLAYRK